jgi:DNA polymerase III subunit epsilon
MGLIVFIANMIGKDNIIVKMLNLDRPIVIFDVEATGLSIGYDRIVEIAYIKINPKGRTTKNVMLINPEIGIPLEATEIHSISDETVKDSPTFREKSQELWETFNDCFYGGFNVLYYDLPILKREFIRVGMDFNYSVTDVIDSKVIYHYMEPRTLSAAYKYYCGKELIDAHSALADVEATGEVLMKQLNRYEELKDINVINKIHRLPDDKFVDLERRFYWRNGEAFFAFSKYRDTPLSEVARTNPDFLTWILSADFPEETKIIVKKALEGEFPKKGN